MAFGANYSYNPYVNPYAAPYGGQQMQQQMYQPQMQQPSQSAQQPSNGFVWVNDINEAANYLVAPISLAVAIAGEPLPSTTMTVTPAAVGDFFNVSRTTFIDVPCGCCVTIAVENVSLTAAGAAIPIDVQNASLVIERVA